MAGLRQPASRRDWIGHGRHILHRDCHCGRGIDDLTRPSAVVTTLVRSASCLDTTSVNASRNANSSSAPDSLWARTKLEDGSPGAS